MGSATVVRADSLSRHYRVRRSMFVKPATLKALDGVSFELESGKTLAVVGESGCGKSTLARLVTLIEAPTGGRLEIDGQVLKGVRRRDIGDLRRAVQLIFQDPYGSLNPRKKVSAILEEPLIINTRLSRAERRAAGADMLDKVGLRPEQSERYPHMFSGGQRQRIAIARALMLRPKIVVADEPVSALDVSIQAQILNLLKDLQDEFNLAYLFIAHDLGVVRHIADDIIVMYLGRVVEHGSTEDIFARAHHPYTQALLASTPRLDPKLRRKRGAAPEGELPSPLNPPPGCAFHGRCPHATDLCRQERPELRAIGDARIACHHAEAIA